MSVMLEKAKAHFRALLSEKEVEIKVPEWGGSIFIKPMNGMQRDAVMKHVANGEYEAAKVEAIIQRALDADGNRIFRPAERQSLMREVDPKIIERITGEMGTFESMVDENDEPIEVELKNS